MNYQFRADRVFSDVSNVLVRFAEKAESGFLFEHPETPKKCAHIHGYMFNMSIEIKTFRGKVKKTFSLTKADYETSDKCGEKKQPIDISGAYAYGSRFAQLRPLWVKNFSPAQLEALQIYSRELGDKIEFARASREKIIEIYNEKPESRQYYDICEAVIQEAKNTPGIYENKLCEVINDGYEYMELRPCIVQKNAVYEILKKHLRKHRMVLEINQICRFMATILRDDPNFGISLRNAVWKRLNLEF